MASAEEYRRQVADIINWELILPEKHGELA